MNSKNKKPITIEKFIGTAKYDRNGGFIWGVDEKGNHQMVGEVRGWAAIQNMFKTNEEAEKFQDNLGEFIAAAINQKLKPTTNE